MMTTLLVAFGLILGTFVAEDPTLVTAGVLAGRGAIDLDVAIVACIVGVFVGDLGLWLVGRVASERVVRHVRQRLPSRLGMSDTSYLTGMLERHLALAIVVSRFLPGARLPLYLAAGVWGRRPAAFACWSMVAAVLWTLPVVGLAYVLGEATTSRLIGWLGVVGTVMVAGLVLLALRLVVGPLGRVVSWPRESLARSRAS